MLGRGVTFPGLQLTAVCCRNADGNGWSHTERQRRKKRAGRFQDSGWAGRGGHSAPGQAAFRAPFLCFKPFPACRVRVLEQKPLCRACRVGKGGAAGWQLAERRRRLVAMMEDGQSDEEPDWDAVAVKARHAAHAVLWQSMHAAVVVQRLLAAPADSLCGDAVLKSG